MLNLFVEGKIDQQIVAGFANLLKIRKNEFRVHVAERDLMPEKSRSRVFFLTSGVTGPSIVVYDQETGSIADKPSQTDTSNSHPGVVWCPAIPTIEGWLFADDNALRNMTTSLKGMGVIERLPAPENIPYPKAVMNYLAKDLDIDHFMDKIDLNRAADRSPSLRNFLRELELAVRGFTRFDEKTSRMPRIDREVISALVSEVSRAILNEFLGAGCRQKQYFTISRRDTRSNTTRRPRPT